MGVKVNRKLIFDKSTGAFIHDTGEREGAVKPVSLLEDFPQFNPETMMAIEILHGEFKEDFKGMSKLELIGNELVFHKGEITQKKTLLEKIKGIFGGVK